MAVNHTGNKSILNWIQVKLPRIGVWFAVIGCLLFAFSEACAKLIAYDVSAEVIISVRYVIHGFTTAPFLFKAASALPSVTFSQWCFALAGAVSTGLTSYVANYGYHYIPLLDVFVLTNAQPVFAAVISWIWLKEKLTFYDLGIIIVTLVGVVIACQPTFIFGNIDDIDSVSRLIGSAFGLSCAFFMSLTTCFARKLKDAPSSLIVYLQSIGGTSIGLVGGMAMNNLYFNSGLTVIQILALVFAGILGFLARGLFTLSAQTENATLISVIQTLEIPFSFFVQLIMLGVYPNSLSVIGAIIVMIGTALLAAKKGVKKRALYLTESFKSRLRPNVQKRNFEDEKTVIKTNEKVDYGTKS